MAKGPEARFRDSVEKHLSKAVYKEGMSNPYRGGTPDRYYEGPTGALWAEYKWKRNQPSELQSRWLERAQANGVHVCIIRGWEHRKLGYIAYPNTTHFFEGTPEEIAQWIEEQVNGRKTSGRNRRKANEHE